MDGYAFKLADGYTQIKYADVSDYLLKIFHPDSVNEFMNTLENGYDLTEYSHAEIIEHIRTSMDGDEDKKCDIVEKINNIRDKLKKIKSDKIYAIDDDLEDLINEIEELYILP